MSLRGRKNHLREWLEEAKDLVLICIVKKQIFEHGLQWAGTDHAEWRISRNTEIFQTLDYTKNSIINLITTLIVKQSSRLLSRVKCLLPADSQTGALCRWTCFCNHVTSPCHPFHTSCLCFLSHSRPQTTKSLSWKLCISLWLEPGDDRFVCMLADQQYQGGIDWIIAHLTSYSKLDLSDYIVSEDVKMWHKY